MQTNDNLRKFRRSMAGRGVNIREAIVDGASAGLDVLVANLGGQDVITAAQNVTTPADLTLAMSRVAFTTFFAANKLFRVTMNRATQGGSKMWILVAAAEEDAETSVEVRAPSAAELVANVTMKADDRIIDVLAHVSGGVTIDVTAGELVAAINLSEARKSVTASLSSGSGVTAVTALGPDNIGVDATAASTAAQTGFLLSQGPLASAYDSDADQTAEAAIIHTARIAGVAGDDLDIEYANDTDNPEIPYVTVSGNVTTVHIDSGVTLAADVVSAINAASCPIKAALKSTNDGSGVVVTMAAKSLADGRDEGRLRFSQASNGAKVRVAWVAGS